jgi:hypothetical protein
LERARNAREERVATQNFAIQSHDGWISGQIAVQDTSDDAAHAEIQSRLVLLLNYALTELGRYHRASQ